ncbi:MAG: hypothetical protein D6701_04810 [Gemmatimonadetes bacterium]|nr:MAG: hypothetical protein D6701_04810 [Gemmatimonadota bacterium]
MPAVQVPTSLLAMIDASVGGKTGVDTPAGKNLVGAFHPPRVVLADPRVIATLPVAERAQGLVEAVKHGAIRDRAYLDDVSAAVPGVLGRAATEGRGTAGPEGAPPPPDLDAVQRVVAGSVRIKAEVVSADEREGGLRKILNFGHTLGHALEAASGYGIGHGAAVALGMVLEARLGEALGVTRPGTAADLAKTLGALDIPLTLPPGVDLAAVEGYLGRDKKARSGRPEFVLLEDLGRVAYDEDWARPVPPEAVREVLTTAAEAAPQGGS